MKRKFLLIGGVLVVVALIALFGYQRMTASAAASTTRVQTAKVTRGSVAATVSAAGNVSAPNSAALAFTSSGRVAKVAVQVGDGVKKGQLLMALDTTDLQLALKTAQASLASAQASYDSSQSTLQTALKTAQANVATAQANYDAAKAKDATNLDQLIVAKASVDKTKAALQEAQSAYDKVAWRSDVGMTSEAANLASATSDYNSAVATYKITAGTINDTSLRSAQAALDSAQAALDQAKKNEDTSTRTAQATLDSAKVAVEVAQRNLDNASLVAPFDGVVSALNYGVGDTTSGTAVSIVDPSNLQVQVSIAEVDIAGLKVGETAEMTLDALTGKTYNAQVISIGPAGTVTSGVVTYPATLQITNSDGAILPGMTASLSIETERHDNVLIVPVRAVRTQGTQKIVTVQANGKSSQKPVSTGLSSDTSVEITAGLQEGDVVVVNQTTSTSTANSGGVGMGILGGIGGGPGGPPPD